MSFRIGLGYDVHPFIENRPLILGGVTIPHSAGLQGHSDADVLAHAITDALFGALALGDIGTHFPDNDPTYKNADSLILLKKSYNIVEHQGYIIQNIDTTIIAEKPRLNPFILAIKESIADTLNCQASQISVKATTSEKMGFVGREEGIAVHAVVLLRQR
ncbi:MAG: 2-C-methyl-D-erythritol 2,4-cyclodiphosphate synthase [Balneolaceae bacterium]|jgi:2-C-methyl-D-erythritol 2,4-cyclodiphosphate synthase|nr:MAG: 2-C-methyl-D-erythritol 2,4-cyclodiphosphate synthase [Balneolaceae bacterium]